MPDFHVKRLQPAEVRSPLRLSTTVGDYIADFTPDDARVLYRIDGSDPDTAFEAAGPRQRVVFDGPRTSAGIVTCGGLCPGMNNIIRGLVLSLWNGYGVRRILGFRYGYMGLLRSARVQPVSLDPDVVDNIHLRGGTVLGSSRGAHDPRDMVDNLERLDLSLLFLVGGDGTMRGAHAVAEEIERRGLRIGVVGVPKTIDNDLPYVERTFGYETAVAIATQAIRAAHVEAEGAPRGIGLVKLMGRHAGFIAAAAAQSSGEANLVLIPEVPFDLEVVFDVVRRRLDRKGHVVVVVAEGAGQRHLDQAVGTDASGNKSLGNIGRFLKAALQQAIPNASVKYIDPSYMIRAAPAHPVDAIFCSRLAEDAVHAGMAGRTDMVVGLWANRFTHVPLEAVTSGTKKINPDGGLWRGVVELTGQPHLLTLPPER